MPSTERTPFCGFTVSAVKNSGVRWEGKKDSKKDPKTRVGNGLLASRGRVHPSGCLLLPSITLGWTGVPLVQSLKKMLADGRSIF